MAAAVAAALLTALAGVTVALVWRTRSLSGEVDGLTERLDELAARLAAAETELSRAATSAEVAESLLVEKGIADEDDVEDARRRFGGEDRSDYVPSRDGELN